MNGAGMDASSDQPAVAAEAAGVAVAGVAVAAARAAVAAVVDPEIRVVTIEELGILRSVELDPATGEVHVTITPTYTGCPAMDVIRSEIRAALARAGVVRTRVDTVLAPAWTTDWISYSGRRKLGEAGIAPPGPAGTTGGRGAPGAAHGAGPTLLTLSVRCPHCGSMDTEQLSRFGSTACKALLRCCSCREPFEQVKAL